ncbi:MAG: hypothetical protein COW00_11780 [Bdellovibrio sp. CG12_big_fil_rev_8_21_14_0_65_39_13]|nr:MAG: hypothetical protein COW78_12030 [Bdellovibrio sp. CG22_combo_CG10-13_8_21_14_all_39_27]PIQ59185.1 MAG: hypothetical protein COW00_11780 [Bdellovibrio sp. CG12_big_fil_rev_8_21_14_0_65_39_13]PIR32717.1 MAG: hypothetical protein COV37_18955 [Bdellovibrio sp. CG11_big_fil_rev_8_21_14_0_20_39_38]
MKNDYSNDLKNLIPIISYPLFLNFLSTLLSRNSEEQKWLLSEINSILLKQGVQGQISSSKYFGNIPIELQTKRDEKSGHLLIANIKKAGGFSNFDHCFDFIKLDKNIFQKIGLDNLHKLNIYAFRYLNSIAKESPAITPSIIFKKFSEFIMIKSKNGYKLEYNLLTFRKRAFERAIKAKVLVKKSKSRILEVDEVALKQEIEAFENSNLHDILKILIKD